MSTKLYHGYRLDIDGDSLFDFMAKAQRTLQALAKTQAASFMAEVATGLIDYARTNPKDSIRDHVTSAFEATGDYSPIRLAGSKVLPPEASRESLYDLQCSLIVMEGDGKTLGLLRPPIFHPQADAYTEAWEGLPGVEPYPYWNDTDERPDGVSHGDWEARGEEWRRAFRGTSANMAGMTSVLVDRVSRISAEEVARFVPTLSERAERVAFDQILNDRWFGYLSRHPGISTGEYAYQFSRTMNWMRGKTAATRISDLAYKMRDALIPEITADVLESSLLDM